jgi:hypothetical protein
VTGVEMSIDLSVPGTTATNKYLRPGGFLLVEYQVEKTGRIEEENFLKIVADCLSADIWVAGTCYFGFYAAVAETATALVDGLIELDHGDLLRKLGYGAQHPGITTAEVYEGLSLDDLNRYFHPDGEEE